MPSSVSADFSLWKTRINVWKRTSYLFRRISLLRCWEFRTRWFSNLGLYTFSWFKLYWRQFSITRSVLLSIYSLKTWINVCNRVKSSFSTLFLRFILGFPFLLEQISGFTVAMTLLQDISSFYGRGLSMCPSCDGNILSFLVTVPAEERRASRFYFSENQESLIKVFLVLRKFCDWFIHKTCRLNYWKILPN